MANLYVMVGIPGMGKSTFIKNHIKEDEIYVSRDVIRFSLVSEDEEYFSKEKDVYKEFIKLIEEGLKAGHNVYADATHLNKASRNKLFNSLNNNLYDNVYAIYLKGDLKTALERNENRINSRAYVPPSVIKRMAYQMEEPSTDERFNKIYVVENNKLTVIKKE